MTYRNLNKLFIPLVLLALPWRSWPSQQAGSPKTARASSALISHYMRETGLTYLDYVAKMFERGTRDHIAFMRDPIGSDEPLSVEDNLYGKALASLEDHIQIEISSGADKRFFDLLKDIKSYASISYYEVLRNSDPSYKNMPANPNLAKLYPICAGQAHGIILSGEFTYGACSKEKLDEAAAADAELKKKK